MFFNSQNHKPKPEDNSPCENKVIHIIKSGDTLYSLANRYNTTVGQILARNPGTDIYNLTIGASLVICPGITPVPPIGTPPPMPPVTPIPPIGPIPPIAPPTLPVESIRELLMCILRWIRENIGENEARRLMTSLTSEILRY